VVRCRIIASRSRRVDIGTDGGSILVTADKDFGELVFRLRRASAGVILLRLAGVPNLMKAEIAAATIAAHESEMAGAFIVIEPNKVRIRRANA
jgi:predicted nuclease of predicted toxin-antitoxin system